MLAPKAGGQYFSETKAGCALGMAAAARGCTFGRVTEVNNEVNDNDRRTLGAEGVWGRWVLRLVMHPCDCWGLRVPRDAHQGCYCPPLRLTRHEKKELDTGAVGSMGPNLGAKRSQLYADCKCACSRQSRFTKVAYPRAAGRGRMAADSTGLRGAAIKPKNLSLDIVRR
jgi:hypothetical protein